MMESFQKGHVFPRKSKRSGLVHVIRYRIQTADGKVKHVSETIHTPRKKEAEKVLDERLEAVNGGAKLPTEITFKQFVDDHWEAYVTNLKPSTQSAHRSNASKHFLPAFGGCKLKDIRAERLARLFDQKRQAGLKPKSRLNLYLLLSKMFNLAVDLELLDANPLRRVPKPRAERQEKPTLAPQQLEALIAAVPVQYRALFVVLAFTGLRVGEVLGLKWADVDFDNGKLYVRRSVWRGRDQTPKSNRSVRAKHMVPTLVQALTWHWINAHYTEPESYVFSNGAGRPLNPDDLRRRVLYKAMDKVGISRTERQYGFHVFRHSAGTELQQVTGNLKTTSSFLGHASTAITGDVYAHLIPDAERQALEKLESALGFSANLFPNVPKTANTVN